MGRAQGDIDAWTLAAFAGVVVVGGANFVAVKETVGELDPLYGAAARFALAGLVFFAILAVKQVPFPRGRALLGAALYGTLGFGTAYALMYVALVELSAGMASVLLATVPIFTLALAALQRLETMTLRGLAGGVLAVVGIVVLSVESLGGDVPLGYLLAALGAPIVIAQSAIVAKRFPKTDPVATNAVGMLVGATLLGIASLAAGETWALPREGATWLASVWLVLAGSVGLFWLFLIVVQRWTASASTYALPLMPFAAIGLGVALQDESLGPAQALGAAIVIAAVYVGAVRRPHPAVEPTDPGGCVGADDREEPARAPEAAPAAAS